jgi:hypothetical protein|nr:hypothetical protein [uncultured Albidiferax sp.]
MPDTSPSPDKQRFASASGPVNRRTAAPAPATPVVHPVVQQKIARKALQHLLGSPLAEQLAVPAAKAPTPHDRIAVVVGLTLAGTGVLLAGLQGAVVWAAGSALAGAAVGAYALVQRRNTPVVAAVSVWDPQALAALDKVLTALAPEVPAATLEQLVGIKTTLVRIAPLLATATVNQHFTQDDKFYLVELVRRYLPDTLAAFLAVPSGQREVPGAQGGPSALALLGDQLRLLHTELSRREVLLVQNTHGALEKQQRFLHAKHP